jgi:hypothetical protein
VHNKGKILLVICVLCLILFLKQSKVPDRGATSTGNTLNTSPVKKSVDNINPGDAVFNELNSKSASEKDFLGMSLEELMQIPVASISTQENNDDLLDKSLEELMKIQVVTVSIQKNTNLLDKSLEELMKISVTGFASEQRRKT